MRKNSFALGFALAGAAFAALAFADPSRLSAPEYRQIIVGGGALVTGTVEKSADLGLLSTAFLKRVSRLGHAALGDAPAVDYIASASACSLNAGAGDGVVQVPSSNGKCWLAQFNYPVDIRIFGADASGTAASTAAVQNAIANLPNCSIRFPEGTFKIGSTIAVNRACEIGGNASGKSIIQLTAATGDGFVVTGGSIASGLRATFRDLTFSSNTTRTANAAIRCQTICYVLSSHFEKQAIGIYINGATLSVVRDVQLRNATPESTYANSTHIRVDGLATAVILDSITTFTDSQLEADQPRSCVNVMDTDALILTNSDLILCRSVLLINPGAGQSVLSTKIANSFFDTPKGASSYAMELHPNGGNVVRTSVSNSGFGDNAVGGSAILFDISGGNANTFECNNCELIGVNGAVYGVNIANQFWSDIKFIGGCINGFSAANVRSVGGVNDVTFLGVSHGNGTLNCAGPQSPVGFQIEGNVNYWSILGNNVKEPATKINNISRLLSSRVEQNLGINYLLSPYTAVTVSVGASPFNYCNGPMPSTVYVSAGSVTSIVSQGSTGQIGGTFPLGPNECMSVSYSSAPNMTAVFH